MSRINETITGFADRNFSLVSIMLIIVAFFGVLWLNFKGVSAGQFYIILFTAPLSLIALIFLLIKEKNKEFYFSLPVSRSSKIGALRYWLGFIIPFILTLGTGGWFITSKIVAPLVSFDAFPTAGQSFATLEASFDQLSRFFIGVWTAGAFEEFILGFLMVTIGLVVAYFIMKNTKIFSDMKGTTAKIFAYGIAFAFSIVFFVMLHIFNPQYDSIGVFLIAGIFRLLMNILMFFFLGIEFTIGFHMANNLLFFGVGASIIAIISSVYGWIVFIPLFAILIYLAVLGLADFISGKKSWLQLFSMKS